jgi:ArsR family metal-binding transcriptional regulator
MPEAGDGVLIESFGHEVFTPPCDPGAERLAARARLNDSIADVLPYLNATMRGAVFNPAGGARTLKKGGDNIAFHSFEIATRNVEDREAALLEIPGLVDLVNRTCERRKVITPAHQARQRPTPMAITQHRPHINCKRCGWPTSLTFVRWLAAAQLEVSKCPLLLEPERAGHLEAVRGMLVEAPRIG